MVSHVWGMASMLWALKHLLKSKWHNFFMNSFHRVRSCKCSKTLQTLPDLGMVGVSWCPIG
jgi:hypothetical protein